MKVTQTMQVFSGLIMPRSATLPIILSTSNNIQAIPIWTNKPNIKWGKPLSIQCLQQL